MMINLAVLPENESLLDLIGFVCERYDIGAVYDSRLSDSTDILILCGKAELSALSSGTVIIADTQSPQVIHGLMPFKNTVIGCSASPKDTLTLACRSRDKLVACLRRTISTLSGLTVEPCEMSVIADEAVPLFAALAACAVLLLNGQAPPTKSWFFS